MSTTITPAASPSAKKSQRKPAPGTVQRALYSIEEFADLVGVCRVQVYFWMRHGKLAFVQLGCQRRIPAAELERVVQKGISMTPEEHRALREADRQNAKRKALLGE